MTTSDLGAMVTHLGSPTRGRNATEQRAAQQLGPRLSCLGSSNLGQLSCALKLCVASASVWGNPPDSSRTLFGSATGAKTWYRF